MFSFNHKKVVFTELLGKGGFGAVYPYRNETVPQDKRWVMKVLYPKNTQQLFSVVHEIVVGFSCDHPSILPLRGYHVEENKNTGFSVYIKLPRMKESLRDKIINYEEKEILNSRA